jgi:sulfonate transport system permease protein
MSTFIDRHRRTLRGLFIPASLLVLWEVSSHAGLVNPAILPPLEAVGARLIREIGNGELFTNLGASLARNLAGFAIGTTLGVAFGALLGLSRLADGIFGPSFNALKQIALLAWIPLLSIWFGFGETAKVVFIALAAFIPVVLNTYEGTRSVSVKLLEVGTALTFSRAQLLRRVFLPSAVPSILNGIQLALIYSWLATVASEYFMSVGPGIGGLVVAGRERFEMDLVMLGIVILGLVGLALNRSAQALEHRFVRGRAV